MKPPVNHVSIQPHTGKSRKALGKLRFQTETQKTSFYDNRRNLTIRKKKSIDKRSF